MNLPLYILPARETWNELLQRPAIQKQELEKTVGHILEEVRTGGDDALRKFALRFDKVELNQLHVTEEEIEHAESVLPAELKDAILLAYTNIERFHLAQVSDVQVVETMPGVKCWRRSVAIDKVGLYIPGGSAPLFSTILMLGIPAKIAGCKEVILCSPCNSEGVLHPAILYTAKVAGITKIFKVGGAQAIAAMAYGTASIPGVYKIFGPGNQYVTSAKQLVQKDGVAIDMPAGPSEVAVLADDTAEPAFVAADLLSQAEHGPDSQVLLVTTSEKLAEQVREEVSKQWASLSRNALAEVALSHSKLVVVENMKSAIEIINQYAAEHLIISCANEEQVAELITNAGSVFIGRYSPESVGDYASGTNHTLPTNGYARAYSGVSVDSFVRKITYQQLSPEGLMNIGSAVELMATAEGLDAHARAVSIRLDYHHQQTSFNN